MAPKTDSTGKIQPKAEATTALAKPKATLAGLLGDPKISQELARAVPKHLTADRMIRLALTALRTTPKLGECSPDSFIACVFQAAQLGLEPNTPLQQCYLIPRWNKKREAQEATFLLGYQGMIDLATRSGRVSSITSVAVREGDVFEYERGLNEKLRHVPSLDPNREQRDITHVYSIARVRNSDPIWEVLSVAQVDARRDRSQASGSGPWVTDYEAMALKTACRALFRWVPKSSELARAEALEVAMETSHTQSNAFAPEVIEALERTGVQAIEPVPPVEKTPEPQEPDQAREPGSEG